MNAIQHPLQARRSQCSWSCHGWT